MTTSTETTDWIALPEAPAIPGLRFRTWRDDRDWERMAEVMTAASAVDGVPWAPTAELLRVEMTDHPGIDPALDIVIAEVDGQLVADGQVKRVVREGEPMYEISGDVHPGYRRRGIGSALHAWNVRRAHERAATLEPGRPVTLGVHAEEGEVGNTALIVAGGFEAVRQFYLMRRDLTRPLPEFSIPDGLEVRDVRPEDHRTIWDAENEAFRSHWGAREHTEHDFALTFDRPELDTSLWVVAWDGDLVAGVVENWIWRDENATLGLDRGWLERVSVGRSWRRRGLGRALTALSLVRLRDAGMTEAMLGVDATNPLGAVALYESVGFEVHRREFAYRRVDGA